jgi:uncharacterized protein YdaU (DUF1376 family)
MPFYVSDYINDHRVMNLTPTGRATYIELLCHSWLLGGSLPYSPAHLWKYTLLQTPEEWNAVADEVLALFEVADGRLVNARLAEEYEESQRLADARIRGGKTTAKKRWGSSVDSSATSPATRTANSSGVARREEKRTKQNKKASEPPSADSSSGLISSSEDSGKSGQENGASPNPVPPTEAGARIAQTLAEVLGRANLKPATLCAWAYQADVLLKNHPEDTITAVMRWALTDCSDGFWRAKILAMKIFVRCFKTMLSQYERRDQKTGAADPVAARATSLRTGHDFSALAKGDF